MLLFLVVQCKCSYHFYKEWLSPFLINNYIFSKKSPLFKRDKSIYYLNQYAVIIIIPQIYINIPLFSKIISSYIVTLPEIFFISSEASCNSCDICSRSFRVLACNSILSFKSILVEDVSFNGFDILSIASINCIVAS